MELSILILLFLFQHITNQISPRILQILVSAEGRQVDVSIRQVSLQWHRSKSKDLVENEEWLVNKPFTSHKLCYMLLFIHKSQTHLNLKREAFHDKPPHVSSNSISTIFRRRIRLYMRNELSGSFLRNGPSFGIERPCHRFGHPRQQPVRKQATGWRRRRSRRPWFILTHANLCRHKSPDLANKPHLQSNQRLYPTVTVNY